MSSELPPPHSEQTRWFSDDVQPHEPALRSYLRNSFPSVQDIDDVVQESFLRIWRARAKQPINSAKAFLFKVARHMAIDVTRRNKISPIDGGRELDALLVMGEGLDVADAAVMHERALILARAIEALPERCREVVVLRKFKDLPQKEVAALLGLSERTVEAQLARGVKRCEAYLRKRGIHNYYADEER